MLVLGDEDCHFVAGARLLVGDVDHVVVGNAIDQLVVGVDAGERGLLVDDNLEGSVLAGEPLLLQVEGLFFIFLAAEDADFNVGVEGHGLSAPLPSACSLRACTSRVTL